MTEDFAGIWTIVATSPEESGKKQRHGTTLFPSSLNTREAFWLTV
jgi:hypothetical protein